METIQFEVSVPTDGGFLGRECNDPTCQKYFRVHSDSIKNQMYCPYCGNHFSSKDLHTPDQVDYLKEAGREKALEYAYGEIDKMFKGLAQKLRGNKFVKLKHRPLRYRAKPVVPRYQEQKVDSELVCPECSFRVQVFGLFGYCPGCRTENMLIYDANLAIIRAEVAGDSEPQRALRHAYYDLVSTFEAFCTKKAMPIKAEKPSFQELFPTRKFFKKHMQIDIFDEFSNLDLLCLRRVFQKRHAFQHSEGRITEQYVRKVPEDKALLGTQAQLSLKEFEDAAKALRLVVNKLIT